MKSCRTSLLLLILIIIEPGSFSRADAEELHKLVRIATFNASLYRNASNQLITDLKGGDDQQAKKIAEIVQRTRPDILLVNEFDYDAIEAAAQFFCSEYLQVGQNGQPPIIYPYFYSAPVNTGVPTHLDLDRDGQSDQPNDAYGFGRHPGQYGMLLLSRYPIQDDQVRTFQKFLWKDMPGNLLPVMDDLSTSYYTTEAVSIFRLSSKSHWDIPIKIGTKTIHVLAAHPTPPSFDGPEIRNGRRNHDEIRLWADYIDPARSDYLYDDEGQKGGLAIADRFLIIGDYNADPFDGGSVKNAINQLLDHPLIDARTIPASKGAVESSEDHSSQNRDHRGQSAFDTANFSSGQGPGNLRVDYVLPSQTLHTHQAGVFWPTKADPAASLMSASDHHLVWLDIIIEP
jgi:uncharacterized protein YdaT